MECVNSLINKLIFSSVLLSAWQTFSHAEFIPPASISDNRNLYSFDNSNSSAQIAAASLPATALFESDINIGFNSDDSHQNLRDQADSLIQKIQSVFSSPTARDLFYTYPNFHVRLSRIYTDTRELRLKLTANSSEELASAKQQLLDILKAVPTLRFAGEKKIISIGQ